uniref:F-box domain-containing protein n=1 Tax=Metarhizium rileyi (strain RCEF 4871) TaxID=1649241 RepID=A0A5C6GI53_METRR
MTATSKLYACLAGLPVEILLDIYQHLDLRSIFELSLTNTEFFIFFQRRKSDIIIPVLKRDFSPFDEFVQVYTASAGDIACGGIYKPRKVVFHRFGGDIGVVLSNGASTSSLTGKAADDKFTKVIHARHALKAPCPSSDIVLLTALDLNGLLKQCRIVREWEELFPQMRWFYQPESCRLLRPHEQIFVQTSLPGVVDRSQSLATSWNDQSHWGRIVKTFAKLGPEDLLYYFNNIYSYPWIRLIKEIKLRHPDFTCDQESIQIAVRCALEERNWRDKKVNLAEHDVGGIIDFDDDRDEDRFRLRSDASPTGQLPGGSRFILSHSRYSPRGDDGTFLDDYLRLSATESRLTISTFLGAAN